MNVKNKIEYQKKILSFFILITCACTSFLFFEKETSFASEIGIIPIENSNKKEKNYKEGEVIVKYKDKDKLDQKIEKINRGQEKRNLAGIKKEIDNTKIVVVRSENKKTQELIEELKDDENVEIVEPNYKREFTFIPNDTYFSSQWAHRNIGQSIAGKTGTNDADADIVEAWDIENSGAAETIVAVIDSGALHSQADLSGNMWDGTICVDENNVLIAGGCPNHGWDYENDDNDPNDETGHGTHIASIIGNTADNSSGMAGVSRYNNIKVMALRFDLYVSTEIEAINFAKNNGAKVINGSFSGEGYSATEKEAIDGFDGLVVVASGNGGDDEIGDNNDNTHQYPCDYTSNNIICVGASDQDDEITDFSNYSTTSVDLVAPGDRIIGIENYPDKDSPSGYIFGAGTSFASPLVAGAAGLLYAHDAPATTSEIKNLLLDHVDVIPSLSSKVVTSGRLNLHTSLDALLGDSLPPQRSNGQPSSSLSYGTTSTSISLTTNENATCKYSTSSTTSYDSMTNTFSTTGGATHSQSVSGLENGNSYTYYVRCMDENNNKNTSDYEISFSVTDEVPTQPVYRFYSQNNKAHFFTISATEKEHIIATYPETEWRYEGVAYYVPTTSSGNQPVYRFYSQNNKAHFFTISANEKEHIIATYPETEWRYEGIAYYVPN
jgi:subtilisin family serine protease